MALTQSLPSNGPALEVPEAGPSSPSGSSRPSTSFDLPSLQPLSHTNPYLSADDFDADAFLLTRAHIPLEELRGELREYLGQLREELVQLINDDYEEFISLGTGLRGEEERLIRLGKPLDNLKEEVKAVRDSLSEQQTVVQEKLDQRAALREEKVSSSMPRSTGLESELIIAGSAGRITTLVRYVDPRRGIDGWYDRRRDEPCQARRPTGERIHAAEVSCRKGPVGGLQDCRLGLTGTCIKRCCVSAAMIC